MRRAATLMVLAMLVAGLAASSVSAATIAVSPAGSVTATASPYDISTTAGDISCTATFSGRLSPSIPTSAGAFWGDFSSGSLSGCTTTGSVLGPVILLFLVVPTITVQQILGTPPAVTGVLVTKSNVQISFTVLGVTCLYRGNINYLAPFVTLRNGDRAVGTFTPLAGQSLPLIFGGAPPCPRAASVAGTSWTYTPLQKVTII